MRIKNLTPDYAAFARCINLGLVPVYTQHPREDPSIIPYPEGYVRDTPGAEDRALSMLQSTEGLDFASAEWDSFENGRDACGRVISIHCIVAEHKEC